MSGGHEGVAGSLTALVLAGGDPPARDLVPPITAGVGLVVAADGGLRHADHLGVTPDVVVGDMDSVDPADLALYPAGAVERHPPDKDQLDLELALTVARSRGAAAARVAGALGDRFDQSVASLLIAARLAGGHAPFPVSLHSQRTAAAVASPALPVTMSTAAGSVVSLLALSADPAVVSATGVAYPVRDLPLGFGTGHGVSNIATVGSVHVSVKTGVVAVIVLHGYPLDG